MSILGSLKREFAVEWRQMEAIEKARKEGSPNVRIFAFEDPRFKPGCRKYIDADLRKFYLWYRTCALGFRHFYELITEHTPCRLYFDLEFDRKLNPDLDALSMLDDFCRICCRTLRELIQVELDPARDMLILDSSSQLKFSAHVIVHIPATDIDNSLEIIEEPHQQQGRELLFPDNIILKPLVMYICSFLEREGLCIVKTGEGRHGYLCDLSVYSRNRNFRLFQSNKCGKNEWFKLADYCTFYNYNGRCKGRNGPKNAQIFLDSLVIPYDHHNLPVIDLDKVAVIQSVARMLKSGRRIDTDPNQPSIESAVQFQQKGSDTSAPSSQSSAMSVGSSAGKTTELGGGPPPSPFPLLDQFMLSKFQVFNPQTQIRVWRFVRIEFSSPEGVSQPDETSVHPPVTEGQQYSFKMQYQLTNSRYCMNRGREHRNQNVYWVVDLGAFYFLQRCFDRIDCPNYTSPAFALSAEMCQYLLDNIRTVLDHFRIPSDQYIFTDLEQHLANRYRASTDSFNKSMEWSQKYGELAFLELLTPCEEYTEEEKEQTLIAID